MRFPIGGGGGGPLLALLGVSCSCSCSGFCSCSLLLLPLLPLLLLLLLNLPYPNSVFTTQAQAAIDVPYTGQFWGGLHYNGNNALLDGSSVSNSNNWCLSQSKLLAFMTDRLLARDSSGQCARCMDGPHEEPTLANRLCVSLESSFRGSTCMGELARSRCSNQADLFDLFSRPGVSGLLSAVVTSRRQRICG